ncbi:hypothetical protein FSP39_015170 [Pinctada imbricata]|uniref:Uncharacterized protein n=1 Tax=Pinctada imbricata TaxID=66713 RepID=A0AA89CDD8_PINIB|nr:hypothetical protein FSP39_015170 [Pinctada imbricata]
MEESFLIESPLKVKTAKPRYSSSPVVQESASKEESISIHKIDFKDEITQTQSSNKKQHFLDKNCILAEAPVSGWKSKLSLKKLFGRKKRNPVTLLSFSKSEGMVSRDEMDGMEVKTPVHKMSEGSQADGKGSTKNTMEKSKFIHWDGVTNSIETFFTERLEDFEKNETFHNKYVMTGSYTSSLEEYTVEDIDFELEKCREFLEEAANVTPQSEYEACLPTNIKESDSIHFTEPASLGYLALHAFKVHLKSIQEGLLFPSETLKMTKNSDDVDAVILSEEDIADNEFEVSPDSPSLIDSMAIDVKKLNLTMTPTQSDAEMSQSLNAFLQEALKPIDDLSLQAESSCSDVSNGDHLDDVRDPEEAEDPICKTPQTSLNLEYSDDFRDEEDSGSGSDIFEESLRRRLNESIDRYPSFTYCSPMSTTIDMVEEDVLDTEDGNTYNGNELGKSLMEDEREKSPCSEASLLPSYIHGMSLDSNDYIPRYPGMVFTRSESPIAPLPTPEDERGQDLGKETIDTRHMIVKDSITEEMQITTKGNGEKELGKILDSLENESKLSMMEEDASLENSVISKHGYQKMDDTKTSCQTDRYPRFTLGSLPPLYEDDEDISFWNGGIEETSTPSTGSKPRRHRVNEYPSRFLGITAAEFSPTKQNDCSRVVNTERDCLLNHWTVDEIGKMAKEIVEEMFLDGTITDMKHELKTTCNKVKERKSLGKRPFPESYLKENDYSFCTMEDTERFYTDIDTDADNTLERYFTDYDTSLDGTN